MYNNTFYSLKKPVHFNFGNLCSCKNNFSFLVSIFPVSMATVNGVYRIKLTDEYKKNKQTLCRTVTYTVFYLFVCV